MEEYHIDFYNIDRSIREIIKNRMIDDEDPKDYPFFDADEDIDLY